MMLELLYVVDKEFTDKVLETCGKTHLLFGNLLVMTRTDIVDGGDPNNEDDRMPWSASVEDFVDTIEARKPQLVIGLAHKGVFKHARLSCQDEYRTEVRVPDAEKEVVKRLGDRAPELYIAGFNHVVADGAVWPHLESRKFDTPRFLFKLRAIVADGGGPFGQLSALKHNLMRPFSCVRLQLQLDDEASKGHIDPAIIRKIAAGVDDARAALKKVEAQYVASSAFAASMADAKQLLACDTTEITGTALEFYAWTDQLNAALDGIRAGVD
jgi:hypothetical protein